MDWDLERHRASSKAGDRLFLVSKYSALSTMDWSQFLCKLKEGLFTDLGGAGDVVWIWALGSCLITQTCLRALHTQNHWHLPPYQGWYLLPCFPTGTPSNETAKQYTCIGTFLHGLYETQLLYKLEVPTIQMRIQLACQVFKFSCSVLYPARWALPHHLKQLLSSPKLLVHRGLSLTPGKRLTEWCLIL